MVLKSQCIAGAITIKYLPANNSLQFLIYFFIFFCKTNPFTKTGTLNLHTTKTNVLLNWHTLQYVFDNPLKCDAFDVSFLLQVKISDNSSFSIRHS